MNQQIKNDPAKSCDSSMQGHIIYGFRLSHFALLGISGCALGQKISLPLAPAKYVLNSFAYGIWFRLFTLLSLSR